MADSWQSLLTAWAEFGVDCAQLLDGWHADGTAWGEWDESVRQALSGLLRRDEAFRGATSRLEAENAYLRQLVWRLSAAALAEQSPKYRGQAAGLHVQDMPKVPFGG